MTAQLLAVALGLSLGLYLVSCTRPPRRDCHRAEPFCRGRGL